MSKWNTVSIERDGKVYEGQYQVNGGMMKVQYRDMVEETHISEHLAAHAYSFAQTLLSELVKKSLPR
jgi:hypothetical protein